MKLAKTYKHKEMGQIVALRSSTDGEPSIEIRVITIEGFEASNTFSFDKFKQRDKAWKSMTKQDVFREAEKLYNIFGE